MRKTQIYIDGILTMVEDSDLIEGVLYYNADMTIDKVRALQEAKDIKISAIDSQTREAIVALAGDETKQRNALMKSQMLLNSKLEGSLTAQSDVDLLNYFIALGGQVETLRNDGNAKELLVTKCTTISQVEAI